MHHETFKHVSQVIAVQLAAFGITLSNINQALTSVSICMAIVYTGYKFYKEFKQK